MVEAISPRNQSEKHPGISTLREFAGFPRSFVPGLQSLGCSSIHIRSQHKVSGPRASDAPKARTRIFKAWPSLAPFIGIWWKGLVCTLMSQINPMNNVLQYPTITQENIQLRISPSSATHINKPYRNGVRCHSSALRLRPKHRFKVLMVAPLSPSRMKHRCSAKSFVKSPRRRMERKNEFSKNLRIQRACSWIMLCLISLLAGLIGLNSTWFNIIQPWKRHQQNHSCNPHLRELNCKKMAPHPHEKIQGTQDEVWNLFEAIIDWKLAQTLGGYALCSWPPWQLRVQILAFKATPSASSQHPLIAVRDTRREKSEP